MSDSDSLRRSSPSTNPAKRAGAKGGDQRAPRFEVRQQPAPPPPRPLSKLIDLPEEPPELRPRARSAALETAVRPPAPRVTVGRPTAPPTRHPAAEASADVERAKLLNIRPLPGRSYYPVATSRPSSLGHFLGNPWLVLLVGMVCLAIFLLASAPARTTFSNFLDRNGIPAIANEGNGGGISTLAMSAPAGEHSLIGPPTISAEDVEAVLREYNSPAAGSGRAWIALGQQYGIDPAYALAFFIHESTAGTNPGWAGLKAGGGSTHNIGNIICAGYPTCYGRFRDYASWDEGIEDWYKLIAQEYIQGRSAQTVEQIIPIYAPAFENNVDAYVNAVVGMVDGWRRQRGGQ
jgi:Mannosyl-glycoprotein endo-beta-N-acetylglucosaminidase